MYSLHLNGSKTTFILNEHFNLTSCYLLLSAQYFVNFIFKLMCCSDLASDESKVTFLIFFFPHKYNLFLPFLCLNEATALSPLPVRM